MSPDELQARLIASGLRLARSEGLGLPLVNALRESFPDVDLKRIGEAATTIGQGINAASIMQNQPLGETLDLDLMPILPNALFGGNEIDRVKAFADVSLENADVDPDTGEPIDKLWDVRTECGEGITFQELIDCIQSHLQEIADQDEYPELDKATNWFIRVYFMGKRF